MEPPESILAYKSNLIQLEIFFELSGVNDLLEILKTHPSHSGAEISFCGLRMTIHLSSSTEKLALSIGSIQKTEAYSYRWMVEHLSFPPSYRHIQPIMDRSSITIRERRSNSATRSRRIKHRGQSSIP